VFGFAEWNGRSLIDSAPNVMFSLAANTPLSLGIGKQPVASKPSTTFRTFLPYQQKHDSRRRICNAQRDRRAAMTGDIALRSLTCPANSQSVLCPFRQ
jgi:hypothetical protein